MCFTTSSATPQNNFLHVSSHSSYNFCKRVPPHWYHPPMFTWLKQLLIHLKSLQGPQPWSICTISVALKTAQIIFKNFSNEGYTPHLGCFCTTRIYSIRRIRNYSLCTNICGEQSLIAKVLPLSKALTSAWMLVQRRLYYPVLLQKANARLQLHSFMQLEKFYHQLNVRAEHKWEGSCGQNANKDIALVKVHDSWF